MEIENEKIVIDKNGQQVECDVMFTFDCEDNGKSYVGFTDNELDNDGKKNLYVACYDPVLGLGKLEDVKEKEEWDMINEVIADIKNSNN